MECDAELTCKNDPSAFQLEKFSIGKNDFNFTFIGHGNKNQYVGGDYSLVYVYGNELELVKNFLTTIRS